MEEKTADLIKVSCPGCHTILWIDPLTQAIIKSEKRKKETGSLDELLLKEKQKKEEVDRRFETTAELEKRKKKAAEDQFAQAFSKIVKEE